MPDTMPIYLTKHARRRCAQREICTVRVLAVVALRMAEAKWPKVKLTIIDKDISIIYDNATGKIFTVHFFDPTKEDRAVAKVLAKRARVEEYRRKHKYKQRKR